MKVDDQIQIVAVMPGGGFESLGIIELANLDALLTCMASRDMRGSHEVSVIDIKRAFDEARRRRNAQEQVGNNDGDADGA